MSAVARAQDIADVRKEVVVPLSRDLAFLLFVEEPMRWWPPHHCFVQNRVQLTIDPQRGGLVQEVGAAGDSAVWGRVVQISRPHRFVMTWRVGANFRPVLDDDLASFIEVDFVALESDRTMVVLTHAALDRHGPAAEFIHAALDGPSPGETLTRFKKAALWWPTDPTQQRPETD